MKDTFDGYIWLIYLTDIFDGYIRRIYLTDIFTDIFDGYIWRIYLTGIFDGYIWRIYLTDIFTNIFDGYIWLLGALTFRFLNWIIPEYLLHLTIQNHILKIPKILLHFITCKTYT